METNHLIQAKNSGCGLEVGKPFYVASICHVKGQSKRKNFLVHVEALLQYSYTCIIHWMLFMFYPLNLWVRYEQLVAFRFIPI